MKKFILLSLCCFSTATFADYELGGGIGFHLGEKAVTANWDEDDLGVNAGLFYNKPGSLYGKLSSNFDDFHSVSAGYSLPLETNIGNVSVGIGAGLIDYKYSDDAWLVSLMVSSNVILKNLGQAATFEFNRDTLAINWYLTFKP